VTLPPSLSLCLHIYYWRVDRERTQEYLFFNMEAEEDKIDTLTCIGFVLAGVSASSLLTID